MSAHALLSPSSAHKWMNCPPSARLETQFPDSSSESAREGTHAHAWAEMRLRHYLEPIPRSKRTKEENELKTSQYHSSELEDAVEVYVSLVKSLVKETKKHCADPLILIEEKVKTDEYVPEGFGNVDCVIIADDIMNVIDYKNGVGVGVSALENPQIRLYALGALQKYDALFDIKTVRMTICQPNIDNVTTEELSVIELRNWAETVLAPLARQAFDGEGELLAGDHCKFCRAKPACRAYSEGQLLQAREDFALPHLLSNDEIAQIIGMRSKFKSWLDDVYAYALAQARDAGERYPGYKLVEGRSNRVYKSDQEVLDYLASNKGYDPSLLTETSVIGITKLTKIIGAKEVAELEAQNLIYKPAGSPTLVSQDDNRPELLSAIPEEFKEAI